MNSKFCPTVLLAAVLSLTSGTCSADPLSEKSQGGVRMFATQPIVAPDELPLPDKIPPTTKRRDKAEIVICPGQVELGSVCVYAGNQPLKDVTIRISDLTAPAEGKAGRGTSVFTPLPEAWKFKPDPNSQGLTAQWFSPYLNDSTWAKIRTDIDQGWDKQGFEDQALGYGWYRQELAPNGEAAKAKHRYLFFQAVDEEAYVYLNGKLIFKHTTASTGLPRTDLWNKPFMVTLDRLWQGRTNASLVVRVHNSAAMGGIWKPVFLFSSNSPLTVEQMSSTVVAQKTQPAYRAKKEIAARCFDPYVLQWWYRRQWGVPADERKPLWRGELLLKDTTLVMPDHEKKTNKIKYPDAQVRDAETLQPKSLESGQGVQYLIFARIPSATPPGRYTGKVEAISGGKTIAEIPLEVTVLPFRLADSLLDYTIYYRGSANTESNVADMLDHGINRMIWFPYTISPDGIIALRQKFGIKGAVFLLGFVSFLRGDDGDAARIESGKKAIDKFRAAGCDPIYVLVQDEPFEKDMPMVRAQIDNVHRLFGAKTCGALCRSGSWENLKDHLDLPNLFPERFGDRKGIAQWQSVGKPVYVYGLASFHADALRFRRYYGLHPWKLGAQGCAPYAYQHPQRNHTWDSFAHTVSFTWPTADGQVSTIQWEGMRSAITDVRYVSTLIEWLGRTAGPLARHPARAAAERTLATLDSDGDLDAQRNRIIKCILALKQAMAEVPE